jgi:hypothetical protein
MAATCDLPAVKGRPQFVLLVPLVLLMAALTYVAVHSRSNLHLARGTCGISDKMDIVVNHFREDLGAVRKAMEDVMQHPKLVPLQPCLHVFTKGPDPGAVRAALPEAVVVWQPNVGREGAAWLAYIVANYNRLPRHVMFLQSNPEYMDVNRKRLDVLSSKTGFICLGEWRGCRCDGIDCGVHGPFVRIREIFSWARNELCFEDVRTCLRGQFVVSAKRIQQQPISFYQRLLEALTAPKDHPIHKDWDYFDERTKSDFVGQGYYNPSDPSNASIFSHVIERMWATIFGCYKIQEPTMECSCPDPTSCPKAPQEVMSACQCMDRSAP